MRVFGVVLLMLAVGCGKGKSSSSSSSGQGGGSKDTGKVYTSDKKGGGAAQQQPSQADADTTNRKASVASDDGTVGAAKGQPVVNPGAPMPKR